MATGSIVMSELHKELMKTRQFKYKNAVDDFLLNCISSGSISIPSVQYLAKLSPEFKADMIRFYDGTFGLYGGVTEIPEIIKVCQASVLDGFCYFYDVDNNSLGGLCTLNFAPLGLDPIVEAKILDKAFKQNQEGKVLSHRVDFTYNKYSSEYADFKTVAHKAVLDEEHIILAPYLAGYRFCMMISNFMKQGTILGVKQTMEDGSNKVRCITENKTHLANYCDSPAACANLKTEYYPLEGFCYAPVLGAPSTTAMLTRLGFFRIDSIVRVASYEKCRELGIQKCKDPVKDLFLEQAILSTMGKLKVQQSDEYTRVLMKMPDIGVRGSIFDGNIGIVNLANYLHTATQGIKTKMLKIVPGAKEALDVRMSVINPNASDVKVNRENIKSLLREHVLKIVWKKSNGMYASIVGTNNDAVLRKVYGDNYMGVYESLGVRIRNMADEIQGIGLPLDLALKDYGFDPSMADKVKEIISEKNVNMEEAMYQALGKKKRAMSSNESLMTVRSLAAYLSSDYNEGSTVPKANDYYASVDIDHIIRAEVIG